MTVAYWAPSSFALLVVAWIPTHKWQRNAITVGFVTSTSVLSLIPMVSKYYTSETRHAVFIAGLSLHTWR